MSAHPTCSAVPADPLETVLQMVVRHYVSARAHWVLFKGMECMQCSRRQQEGVIFAWNWNNSCKPLCRCWEWNQGPLEEL